MTSQSSAHAFHYYKFSSLGRFDFVADGPSFEPPKLDRVVLIVLLFKD